MFSWAIKHRIRPSEGGLQKYYAHNKTTIRLAAPTSMPSVKLKNALMNFMDKPNAGIKDAFSRN